jgi:glucose-6-phosphate 1-dehydrogenase
MADETTTIVIMGATGDLAQRKLLPALFELRCNAGCPEDLRVVGFAHTELSDEAFRELMWKGVQEFSSLAIHKDEWDDFAQHLFYVTGSLGEVADIAAFDVAIMECVLSILPDKPPALERLHGVICPTGYIGITDVTVTAHCRKSFQASWR